MFTWAGSVSYPEKKLTYGKYFVYYFGLFTHCFERNVIFLARWHTRKEKTHTGISRPILIVALIYQKIWGHFFPLLYLQGFRKSKRFGHWALGSKGKKTLKRSEQIKKTHKQIFQWRFYTLYEQKFVKSGNLLSNTFLQGFQKSKKFGRWTLGSRGKKTIKQSEKHRYQSCYNPAHPKVKCGSAEVRAKRHLNGTLKVNRHTHRHTQRHMDQ